MSRRFTMCTPRTRAWRSFPPTSHCRTHPSNYTRIDIAAYSPGGPQMRIANMIEDRVTLFLFLRIQIALLTQLGIGLIDSSTTLRQSLGMS